MNVGSAASTFCHFLSGRQELVSSLRWKASRLKSTSKISSMQSTLVKISSLNSTRLLTSKAPLQTGSRKQCAKSSHSAVRTIQILQTLFLSWFLTHILELNVVTQPMRNLTHTSKVLSTPSLKSITKNNGQASSWTLSSLEIPLSLTLMQWHQWLRRLTQETPSFSI